MQFVMTLRSDRRPCMTQSNVRTMVPGEPANLSTFSNYQFAKFAIRHALVQDDTELRLALCLQPIVPIGKAALSNSGCRH
jgi:hypothetical protein